MPTQTDISSRELMQQIVVRSVIEAVQGMKAANANDNTLLRELKALHGNTTMEDLPDHLKKLVNELTQSMFGYMNRNGYVLVPRDSVKR